MAYHYGMALFLSRDNRSWLIWCSLPWRWWEDWRPLPPVHLWAVCNQRGTEDSIRPEYELLPSGRRSLKSVQNHFKNAFAPRYVELLNKSLKRICRTGFVECLLLLCWVVWHCRWICSFLFQCLLTLSESSFVVPLGTLKCGCFSHNFTQCDPSYLKFSSSFNRTCRYPALRTTAER